MNLFPQLKNNNMRKREKYASNEGLEPSTQRFKESRVLPTELKKMSNILTLHSNIFLKC